MGRIYECRACRNRDRGRMVCADIGPIQCMLCGGSVVGIDPQDERLDALERIVMRQQEEINGMANSITRLKMAQHDVHTRVGVIESRDARYGGDGQAGVSKVWD